MGALIGPILQVKLAQSVKFDGSTNLYTMHVETNDEGRRKYKVKKSYAEFKELEQLV